MLNLVYNWTITNQHILTGTPVLDKVKAYRRCYLLCIWSHFFNNNIRSLSLSDNVFDNYLKIQIFLYADDSVIFSKRFTKKQEIAWQNIANVGN